MNLEQAKYEQLWEQHQQDRQVAPGEHHADSFLSLAKPLPSETVTDFGCGVFAEGQVSAGAASAIESGLADSARLMQLALPGVEAAALRAYLNLLVPEQVETMAGFLQPDGPLFANLRSLGDDVAQLVADRLREAVILG